MKELSEKISPLLVPHGTPAIDGVIKTGKTYLYVNFKIAGTTVNLPFSVRIGIAGESRGSVALKCDESVIAESLHLYCVQNLKTALSIYAIARDHFDGFKQT